MLSGSLRTLLLQRKKLQRVSQIVLKGRGFEPRRKDVLVEEWRFSAASDPIGVRASALREAP